MQNLAERKIVEGSTFYTVLNPSQQEAVNALDGPVLVLAGPGTGKTELLSVRAAHILAKREGILPENILIMTYTNSAAKAIKERLSRVIGSRGYDVMAGTFHGFANSIIQESEEAAEYVGDKVQMTAVEQVRAITYILDRAKGVAAIRPFRAPYFYLNEIVQRIGEMKKDGIAPRRFQEYVGAPGTRAEEIEPKQLVRLKALAVVYERYEEIKEGKDPGIFDRRGRYDFDDMILFATEALRKERGLADEYRRRFRFVMVDEYQDTNEAQLDLLFTLMDYAEPNLCCVGDDDQSIYRFQGASVGNFRVLKDRFPAIKVITLKDNYRSTKEIVDFASRVIRAIPREERAGEKPVVAVKDYAGKEIEYREFTTETEELLFIVDKVKGLRAMIEKAPDADEESRAHPYATMAVLVRRRSDILKVVDAFLQAGIPYATDGKEDIRQEKRVRQLLDVLELATLGPSDTKEADLAFYKVVTADYFRIPLSDILRFIQQVDAERSRAGNGPTKGRPSLLGRFLGEFGCEASGLDQPPSLVRFPIVGTLGFEQPLRILRAAWSIGRLLRDAHANPVHSVLLGFLNDAGLFQYILEQYTTEDILKIRDLRGIASFVNMVKSSDIARPGLRLAEFMDELKLIEENGLSIQGELVTKTQDGIRIFTAHGSKGLEFRTVFIPFCLQKKNWPARQRGELIALPPDLFKTRERVKEKSAAKELFLQDEARLFYVATTRAKANLIFTASPRDDDVTSSYLKTLPRAETRSFAAREEPVLVASLSSAGGQDLSPRAEEVLRDMIRTLSLNPTSLNNYLSCRRKFLYDHVLRLPGRKKQSLVFGNGVHKALEETYRHFKKEGIFPQFSFFEEVFTAELEYQGVDEATRSRCMERMETLKGWFHEASRDPVRPLELERRIAITVGDGITFVGKFDKVELEDEKKGLVKVVDYKTGKPDAHVKAIEECGSIASEDCDGYLRQLVAYKMLFDRGGSASGRYTVRHGELVFVEPLSVNIGRTGLKKGDYVTRSIEIRDDMVKELEGLIVRCWADISALKFERLRERDEKKCGKCDFASICWGG